MRLAWLALVCTIGCGASGSWSGDDDGSTPTQNGGKDGSTSTSQDATTTTTKDSGTTISDASIADDTNYNTASTCTSGTYWTLGSTKSASMEPGHACRSCHVILGQAGSKDFDISGTVYPTAHEPDDCNGLGGMTVVITDVNKTDHVLQVNSVGNFYNDDALGFLKIPTPYTAKVVNGSKVRAMITAQTVGDCNSCHTEQGAQAAPGRIMAP